MWMRAEQNNKSWSYKVLWLEGLALFHGWLLVWVLEFAGIGHVEFDSVCALVSSPPQFSCCCKVMVRLSAAPCHHTIMCEQSRGCQAA